MKNLNKKIIAAALIGAISVGVGISQGHKVFADDFEEINSPVDVIAEEKGWAYDFIRVVSERFGYRVNKLDEKPNKPIKKHFRNPGWFVEYLYDNGAKQGEVEYFWICGYYYKIEYAKKIKKVDYFHRWEYDKEYVQRYGDFVFERYSK